MSIDAAPQSGSASRLFFFHGLESGPHGSKYHALHDAFGAVTSPDFQGMDIHARLAHATRATEGLTDLVVVGSSFGGLLACLLFNAHPERVRGLVLMAPALHLDAASAIERMPSTGHAHIIHGIDDDVVPLEAVVRRCARHGHPVTVVEDDHRLGASRDLMVDRVRSLMA